MRLHPVFLTSLGNKFNTGRQEASDPDHLKTGQGRPHFPHGLPSSNEHDSHLLAPVKIRISAYYDK